MPDMMMNETMVSYQIRFREAELERAWEHRRDLPRETQRGPLSVNLAKIPSIVKGWLVPAPAFGAGRPLQVEALPYRLR